MFADSELNTDFLYETNIKVAGLEIKTQPDYHITAVEPYVSFSELSYSPAAQVSYNSPAATVSYGQASTTILTTPSSVTYEYSPGRVSNAVETTVTKAESELTSSIDIIADSFTEFLVKHNESSEVKRNKHKKSPEEKRANKLEKNRIAGIFI
jgi:hypothetical protein